MVTSKSISGVRILKTNGHAICHIDFFSYELQEIVRNQLSKVCYGSSKALSKRISYSYTNTLKEFIKRYEAKSNELQIGMIGEMLTHILIIEFFPEFDTVSPYFNLEERSIKKGFDLVLVTNENKELWITEVKSGRLHKNKSANETTRILLSKAKSDLNKRLNEKESIFWENAINGAGIALENNKDAKDAVVEILLDIEDGIYENYAVSNDKNVILVTSLFSNLSDEISKCKVEEFLSEIKEEKLFKDVIIFSIQKETYSKIYDFLKKEAIK